MLKRKVIHTVVVQPGIQIKTHHHRIVQRRNRDAVTRQHIEVIFDIVTNLGDRRVFEQRFQLGHRHRHRDLLRRLRQQVAAAMCQRDVAGPVRCRGEAHANKACLHRIERICLGIHRNDTCRPGFGNPCIQRLNSLHTSIAVTIERQLHRLCGFGFGGPARLLPDQVHRLPVRTTRLRAEFLQQRRKAMMFKKRLQRRLWNCAKQQPVERLRQVGIFLQRHQHPAQPRLIGKFHQIVAHLRRLHRRRCGQHRLNRPMFLNQLRRRLRPDARHAWHVVGAIPHQAEHIAKRVRQHPEFLKHSLRTQPFILHRIEHVDAGLDQLHQILVGRHHGDLPPGIDRRARVGGNQIIGLKPQLLDTGQRKRPGRITDHRKLRHQILRRRGPVRLVQRVKIIAERLARRIKNDRHMRRPVGLVQRIGQLPQHRRITINRPDWLPVDVGQRRQPVISPENIARAVDEIEMRGRWGGCHKHGVARARGHCEHGGVEFGHQSRRESGQLPSEGYDRFRSRFWAVVQYVCKRQSCRLAVRRFDGGTHNCLKWDWQLWQNVSGEGFSKDGR